MIRLVRGPDDRCSLGAVLTARNAFGNKVAETPDASWSVQVLRVRAVRPSHRRPPATTGSRMCPELHPVEPNDSRTGPIMASVLLTEGLVSRTAHGRGQPDIRAPYHRARVIAWVVSLPPLLLAVAAIAAIDARVREGSSQSYHGR
jgi:hypothetical protein